MLLWSATTFRPPAAGRAATRLRSSAAADAAAPIVRRTLTRRILSGVQPTGSLHLGNYLDLQDSLLVPLVRTEVHEKTGVSTKVTEVTENFFCVVDLHAITAQPHDPAALLESTRVSDAVPRGGDGPGALEGVRAVARTRPLVARMAPELRHPHELAGAHDPVQGEEREEGG